jgi:L-amino acid N-acyltransferase YncA
MFYKKFKLKDGRTATLDWLEENDLPELVQALNSVIREGKFLFMNNEIDIEEERKWFDRSTKAGMLFLVARVDSKVVGGANIQPFPDKRSHVTDFVNFICDGYRNLGFGTELTKAFVNVAKEHGFEILRLSVFATNERAFHVYKKCGFKECGKLSHDIKFLDGTYTDRILLELPLRAKFFEPKKDLIET